MADKRVVQFLTATEFHQEGKFVILDMDEAFEQEAAGTVRKVPLDEYAEVRAERKGTDIAYEREKLVNEGTLPDYEA